MLNTKSLVLLTTLTAAGVAQAATIHNSGFENGWADWNETDPASISGSAYEGSQSLKISGSPARVYQLVDVEPGVEYTLSAYVKGKGQIGINDNNGLFKNVKFDVSSWTKVSKKFTNADETSLQVFAKHNNSTSDVRFDNFELVATGDSSNNNSSSSNADIPDIIIDGSLFDLEGDDPHPLVSDTELVFVPLETQFTTSGGGGWRHEYKIKSKERKAMYDTQEEFSATYKVELSDGSKTIIAQHHGTDISTLMKLYVADSSESGFFDSEANNGIFDVYVRLRGTDGDEEKFALGTVRSGESFDVTMTNDNGFVTVSAFGESGSLLVEDDDITYFKFGNYLQAQDPVTREDCGTRGDSESWADCYDDFDITTSKITLTNVSYSSNH